jgi:hypothetical protein
MSYLLEEKEESQGLSVLLIKDIPITPKSNKILEDMGGKSIEKDEESRVYSFPISKKNTIKHFFKTNNLKYYDNTGIISIDKFNDEDEYDSRYMIRGHIDDALGLELEAFGGTYTLETMDGNGGAYIIDSETVLYLLIKFKKLGIEYKSSLEYQINVFP